MGNIERTREFHGGIFSNGVQAVIRDTRIDESRIGLDADCAMRGIEYLTEAQATMCMSVTQRRNARLANPSHLMFLLALFHPCSATAPSANPSSFYYLSSLLADRGRL
jgi:hypothetical protein